MLLLNVILLVIAILVGGVTSLRKTVFCYYGSWSYYRQGGGNFRPWHIDTYYCTHVAYAFFGVDHNGKIISLDNFLDYQVENIRSTLAVKKLYPNLKILASVGGWKAGSKNLSIMAASETKRTNFVTSVLEFIDFWDFDGLDIDWEFPAQRGGHKEDKKNFVELLSKLKLCFRDQKLLLSIAVSADPNTANISYDIPQIAKYVNFINLMAYDMNGPWNKVLGHNAPLYGNSSYTVDSVVKYWISESGRPSKILLGIPFFGHTFTLANHRRTNIGAKATGPGTSGPFTKQAGFISYNEICKIIPKWSRHFDANAIVPYANKDNEWLSYDNVQSIHAKVKFLEKHNLGGAMAWAIELDDYRGYCGISYPLLSAIHIALGGHYRIEKETTTPSGFCLNDGFYADEKNCGLYYECRNGQREEYECMRGYAFDENLGYCNMIKYVNCKIKESALKKRQKHVWKVLRVTYPETF